MNYRSIIFSFTIILALTFSVTAQEVLVEEKKEVKRDVLASFPGGDEAFDNYIKNNLTTTNLAVSNNITGEVRIKFIIDENGMAGDFTVMKKLGYGCDEQAIRVLQAMPRWQPGELSGRKIKTSFQKTFYFNLQMKAVTLEGKSERAATPDAPLKFGNKKEDLQEYIEKSFVYPASARKKVDGVVIVKFKINPLGKVEDLNIISGLSEELDKEVARVIYSMPAWSAKQVNYRPVSSYQELTIGFKNKKPLLY